MKTISPAMAAHLKGETTTLTTCWRITRQDGRVFHYTELDTDVTYQGDVYKSAAGFDKSAMKSSATLSVDEMEVTGILHDDGISDDEMRNGAFDFAKVEVFMINYEDESMGDIKLRYGHFGEVKTTGSGAFMVELRGLVDMLGQRVGDTYLNECRLDLGSPKCGIKLVPDEHQAGARYRAGDRVVVRTVPVDEPPRYYPNLVDTEVAGVWPNRMQGNSQMQPRSGDWVAMAGVNGNAGRTVTIEQLGLTPEQVSTGLYKVIFTGWYFLYWENNHGKVVLVDSPATGGQINSTRQEVALPHAVPERTWRPFVVDHPLHPNCRRLSISPEYVTQGEDIYASRILIDDLALSVHRIDASPSGFEGFGGVEFVALNDGVSSHASVGFTHGLGDTIVDGSVTWQVQHPRYQFLGQVSTLSERSTLIQATPLPVEDGWLDWGVVSFLTGMNAGRAMEVANYNPATGAITLALPLPYQPQPGDQFSIHAGCNKTHTACSAKFANILNFRGHPRVPGQGQYFKIAGI